jgi:DNA mismatch repair protein MutS
MTVTKRPSWVFGLAGAHAALLKQLGTKTLDGFGFDEETDGLAIRAAGAIVQYLDETQKVGLPHLDRLIKYSAGQSLEIDEATRRSLELTRTMRDGKREGTLLSVIDRTVTAMGSRLLSEWVASPLTDIATIEQRQDAVKEIVTNPRLLDDLREKLKDVYDMERLLARVTTNRSSPRDLQYVARTLSNLPAVKARLADRKSKLLTDLETSIDLCPGLRAHLERALREDCPLALRDGGIIQPGYNDELDRLHELASGGKQWIASYQAAEIDRTAISSLKVGFNKVFGYYIEITNTHSEKIPPNYIRKQTVKNAERYITPELKEYEEQVLTADERSKALEYELFCLLRGEVAAASRQLRTTAAALAQLDALTSLADLARARNYVCPKIVNEEILNIQAGRHPVVDAMATVGTFVPNDVRCGADDGCILLITGPNMAGKSTYIRQVALIALLAQIGSFVPATSATIGIVDRIFARVGASDELARGQSTFMVEMVETARILNTATSRSLVILDEIGRGTSTYDGVSLAWAVTEYLHEKIGCRTFFATHYHELTDLARELPGLKNWNVAVREWQDQVIFLHQIIPGAADKSYGIHVARLAGIPKEVNERAKDILAQLENQHLDGNNQSKLSVHGKKKRSGDMQLLLFEPYDHPVIDKIRKLDPSQLTPLEALQLLTQYQNEIVN